MTRSTEPRSPEPRSPEPKSADPNPLATAPLLGARPLIRGESVRSYDQLLERICAALQPRDGLEEIWVREVVDLVWEAFRLRRAKAWLMTEETQDRIKWQLHDSHAQAGEIARDWAAGDEDAAAEVTRTLASAGLSLDMLVARSMSSSLMATKRLDRMLVSVEVRRSAVLRDLARYRVPLAQKLRHAIAQAEGAELVPDAPRLAAAQPA